MCRVSDVVLVQIATILAFVGCGRLVQLDTGQHTGKNRTTHRNCFSFDGSYGRDS